jgi:hypothetical protein
MPKLPGANSRLLANLQTVGPLAVYVAATAILVWAATLIYTGVVAPLEHPEPLDPAKVFARQERVNQDQYAVVTKHFPAAAGSPTLPQNPFER